MAARVFVTRRIPASAVKMLHDAFGAESVEVYDSDDAIPREELLRRVPGVEAILAILTERMDNEVFDAAGPQLRIVANMAVGYDNVDVAAATKRGIPVTNTPGVLTETTADLTWAILLATARRLGEGERYLRAGRWKAWGPLLLLGPEVHGKTLGIFGMGRIGQAVAKRAAAFDMPVIYHSRTRLDETLEQELTARFADKETLLKNSDFLSIHCPLTDETKHAFGAEEFRAMKESAVLVNTSRGPVVDEGALVEALKKKEIWAAGLDVFEAEPKVHPGLLELENVLLIPHLGSATYETRAKMAEMAVANILARLEGGTPPNCVNPEVLKD